jgi:tetratricopeptide (TPR) repeat protein
MATITEVIDSIKSSVQSKDFERARDLLDSQSLILGSFRVDTLRALIEYEVGNIHKAENLLRALVSRKPQDWQSNLNLGRILMGTGRSKLARPFLETAYGESGKNEESAKALVNHYLDTAKLEDALSVSEQLLSTVPKSKYFLLTKASSLRTLGRVDEALDVIERILADFPEDQSIALRLRADLIADQDSNNGLKAYEVAIAYQIKNNSDAITHTRWNMSLHLLRVRQFRRGWSYWRLGLHPRIGSMGRALPRATRFMNLVDIKACDPDKWTILVTEQGIGDQVLFMACLRSFMRDHKKLIFVADPRLKEIWRQSFPELIVATPGTLESLINPKLELNGYLPLGTLPEKFMGSSSQFRSLREPYLNLIPTQTNTYRAEILSRAKGRRVIGISWRGGHWVTQVSNKELKLDNWWPLLRRDYFFVDLQYGKKDDELRLLRAEGVEIYTPPKLDYKNDVYEWVSLAAATDEIVTVSTAIAHFAGALGMLVRIVMPKQQGPWILGMNDTEHILYKRTKIYRPRGDEALESLIEKVCRDIEDDA